MIVGNERWKNGSVGRSRRYALHRCEAGLHSKEIRFYRWPEDYNGQRVSVKEGRRTERKKEKKKENECMDE
jgi:hypothetical protein